MLGLVVDDTNPNPNQGARASKVAVRELLTGKPSAGAHAAATNCAFDLFHYHNHSRSGGGGGGGGGGGSGGGDSQRTDFANCGAHIDRGYLSALVCSPVPGLLLCDRDAPAAGAAAPGLNWVEPRRRWPSAQPHRDAVVIVNHALQAC